PPPPSARSGPRLSEARSAVRRHQTAVRQHRRARRQVTRVLSGAVLLVIAVAVVWLASGLIFFFFAEILLVLACAEYAALAKANGVALPAAPAGVAAMLTTAAFTRLT